VADIERSAQEAASIGRRKRNPCVEMGALSLPSKRARVHPHDDWYRVNRGRRLARREALQQTHRVRTRRSEARSSKLEAGGMPPQSVWSAPSAR
jgi:hypothetical protein